VSAKSAKPVRIGAGAFLAATLTLAAAGEPLASPQFTVAFQQTYFSKAPGSSTALRTELTWSDPGELNGKPKPLKRFVLKFQPGTVFDTSALVACKASDSAVQRAGLRACPARSKLGGGSTEGIAGEGIRFKTAVTLFNVRGHIIVLVQVNGRTLTNFRDKVKNGTIHVNARIPAGIALTKLDITIPAHSRKVRKKRRVYTRTPRTCPSSGNWTTKATLIYADGSVQQLTSDSPCTANASRRGREIPSG
jgi:hypothetical protein